MHGVGNPVGFGFGYWGWVRKKGAHDFFGIGEGGARSMDAGFVSILCFAHGKRIGEGEAR